MKMNIRKLVAALVGIGVTLTSLVGVAPATAATNEVTIKLVSPVLNADNTSEPAENQKLADQWVANGWFGKGLVYQRGWLPTGSSFSLKYQVTNADGTPAANTAVILRMGKGYSASNAIVTCGDQTTNGIDRPPLDQARLTKTTDADGYVQFDCKNTDNPNTGEKKPAKWSDPADNDPLSGLFVQFLPQVNGEQPDHSVITEFHFYTESTTVVVPPVVQKSPQIRLVSPTLGATNSIKRVDLEGQFSVANSWYAKGMTVRQAYLPAGSTTTLTYEVLGDDDKPLAGAKVKLHVNKAYSKSNAKVTDGTTPTDPNVPQDADGAIWVGTTGADGRVSFTLKSLDATGIAKPASMVTPVPTENSLFTQIYPELSGQAVDRADMVEFHFYTDTPPVVEPITLATKVTKKKVKGKYVYTLALTINKASGKRADITIGSAKTITKAIAEDAATYKFTVKKGTVKVKVSVDGKDYLKSVSVK